jgi:hypothetical protein
VGRVSDRHGHRHARVERHRVAGGQRGQVGVEPVGVAGAEASLQGVVAVEAGAAAVAGLGQPGPDPLGRGVDGDGVGGVQHGVGDEVVAGQGPGDFLIGGAPVLVPAASRGQHSQGATGQDDRRRCGGGFLGLHADLLDGS